VNYICYPTSELFRHASGQISRHSGYKVTGTIDTKCPKELQKV